MNVKIKIELKMFFSTQEKKLSMIREWDMKKAF